MGFLHESPFTVTLILSLEYNEVSLEHAVLYYLTLCGCFT